MTNRPPVTKAFQVRPANGSFLDRPAPLTPPDRPAAVSFRQLPATLSPLDRRVERIFTLLFKRTLKDRSRPR